MMGAVAKNLTNRLCMDILGIQRKHVLSSYASMGEGAFLSLMQGRNLDVKDEYSDSI